MLELKEGKIISFEVKGMQLKGTIMPSNEKDILRVKLFSGYNAGFNLKEVKNIKVEAEGKKPSKPLEEEIVFDKSKPLITIIHTGGTIASRADYRTGAVVTAFTAKDLLSMFSELREKVNFNVISLGNMWSDDMRFKHYSRIAETVFNEAKKNIKGIIIGHGTDTMHFTAAALSFMLENIQLPVILVGSQRSSDRPSSDAAFNLLAATEFILNSDFKGIAICMHENESDNTFLILPACKTRKMHSSKRNAFKAINDKPIARINLKENKIEVLNKKYFSSIKGELKLKNKIEENIALLKVHPNINPEILRFFKQQKLKGLILEGTGLGHTPGFEPDPLSKGNADFFKALKELIDSGCIVCMTTQCLNGSVNMNVYDKGRDLQALGVLDGKDMLPETAFIKLAWLLGNYNKEEAKTLFQENLQGEINERLMLDYEEKE